jgi:hypothetical protein
MNSCSSTNPTRRRPRSSHAGILRRSRVLILTCALGWTACGAFGCDSTEQSKKTPIRGTATHKQVEKQKVDTLHQR